MNFYTEDQVKIMWAETKAHPEKAREIYSLWFDSVQLAIYRIAGREHGNDSDLVAELRCYLWQHLPNFDPSRSPLLFFVFRVLINHRNYYHKRHKHHNCTTSLSRSDATTALWGEGGGMETQIPDTHDGPTDLEYDAAMRVLRMKIGETYYRMWDDSRNNVPLEEIAERVGYTVLTIKNFISRVNKFIKLGGLWEDWGWEDIAMYVGVKKKPSKRVIKKRGPYKKKNYAEEIQTETEEKDSPTEGDDSPQQSPTGMVCGS